MREFEAITAQSAGTTKKAYNTMNQGMIPALERWKSANEQLKITMGESGIIQGLTGLIEAATPAVRVIGSMPKPVLAAGFAVTALAAAIGPTIIVLANLKIAILAIKTAKAVTGMNQMGKSAGRLTGKLGGLRGTARSLAGTFTSLFLGGDILGGGLDTVGKKGDKAAKGVDKASKASKNASKNFGKLSGKLGSLSGTIGKMPWGNLSQGLGKAGPIAGAASLAIVGLVAAGTQVQKHWGELKQWSGAVWSEIGTSISEANKSIAATIKGDFPSAFEHMGNSVKGILKTNFEQWGFIFGEQGVKALNWGESIVDGVTDGITSGHQKAQKAISELASGVAQKFTGFFKIASPSGLMAGYGTNITQGLEQGIGDGMGNVVFASQELAEAITKPIDELANKEPTGVKAFLKSLSDVFNDTKTSMSGLFGGIFGGDAKESGKQIGEDVAEGVGEGLSEGLSEDLKGTGEGLVEDVAEGIAEGMSRKAALLKGQSEELSNAMASGFDAASDLASQFLEDTQHMADVIGKEYEAGFLKAADATKKLSSEQQALFAELNRLQKEGKSGTLEWLNAYERYEAVSEALENITDDVEELNEKQKQEREETARELERIARNQYQLELKEAEDNLQAQLKLLNKRLEVVRANSDEEAALKRQRVDLLAEIEKQASEERQRSIGQTLREELAKAGDNTQAKIALINKWLGHADLSEQKKEDLAVQRIKLEQQREEEAL